MELVSAAFTHAGRSRARNEDRYLESTSAGIFAVADGMGGLSEGQVASEAAIQAVAEEALLQGASSSLSRRWLADLFRKAGKRVADSADGPTFPDSPPSGQIASASFPRRRTGPIGSPEIGTTLVILCIKKYRFLVGNIGDSRAYHLRGDHVRQITRDHTFLSEMISRGEITPEEARLHPRRGVLTRYLGGDSEPRVDIHAGDVRSGDLFLLASDGLCEYAQPDLITRAAMPCATPQELVDELGRFALDCGGCDNITIIAVQVDSKKSRRGVESLHCHGGEPTVPLCESPRSEGKADDQP